MHRRTGPVSHRATMEPCPKFRVPVLRAFSRILNAGGGLCRVWGVRDVDTPRSGHRTLRSRGAVADAVAGCRAGGDRGLHLLAQRDLGFPAPGAGNAGPRVGLPAIMPFWLV